MKQFTSPPQHESRPEENSTDLLLGRFRSYPSVPIFELVNDDGAYSPLSTADFIAEVKQIAKGLIASGITPVVADQSAGLPPPHADSGRSALAGLQVPDRSPDPLTKPQARVASRAGHTAAQPGGRDLTGRPLMTGSRVVIHRGDTLWSIAARSLPSGPNDVEIQQRWHDIWKQNRLVIGDDPDLIHPGTVLRLPATADHPRPAGKEEN